MSTIDTVTFDLWQTLILDNRELGRARTQRRLEGAQGALLEAGHDYTLDQLQDAYRRCFQLCRDVRKQEKDVTFDEQVDVFIDQIADGLAQQLDASVVERISWWYAEAFFDFPPPADPEAHRVLAQVRSMGYRVGMISNTGQTPGRLFRRYLAQLDLLDFFDVLVFSDEVKLSKPSLEMFQMTLDALGTTPERAVHLGDHIQNDVLGANRAGMTTVLLGDADGQERVATAHIQIGTLGEFPQLLTKPPFKQ